MEQKQKFKIAYSKEAIVFLSELPLSVRKKIDYNINKVAIGVMDTTLFKKLDGTDIWEFRTLYKTQKTPQNEIDKANEIRNKWFKDKK